MCLVWAFYYPTSYNWWNWLVKLFDKNWYTASDGRRSCLMVSELEFWSSGPGLSPASHGVCVLGQDTLLSQYLSPPISINVYREIAIKTLSLCNLHLNNRIEF